MLRTILVGLTAVLTPSTALAADMKIQSDGRICYNAECLGAYDTPEVQCEPAEHAPVPAMGDADYKHARAALIEHGWKPVAFPPATREQIDFFGPSFTPSRQEPTASEREEIAAGNVEVEVCAGSAPVCRYGFADSLGNKLTVVWYIDHSVAAFFRCE